MQRLLNGGMLCSLLLFASPSLANITAFLDSPTTGPVSGNDLVSGWAFALVDGTPVAVSVKVRIDGLTQNTVLCCGPRADVQDTHPDAPLESGFASLIPYGELAAGPHTIGVEITAEGCDPVSINRLIQVVKPGGANFIQSLDFSQAEFMATADGFRADNVQVESTEGTTTDNLAITFSSASQSLRITEAEPGNTNDLCQDPTRTRFLAGAAACRQFDADQTACENAWALEIREDTPTICYFGQSAGFSSPNPGCFGCGPNNVQAGLCQNSC